MDQVNKYVEPAKQFMKDSYRLVKKCTKPDRKGNDSISFNYIIDEIFHFYLIVWIEFSKIAFATAIGFALMGFIGFFVKLIHIPINNIIVYVFNLLIIRFNGKKF